MKVARVVPHLDDPTITELAHDHLAIMQRRPTAALSEGQLKDDGTPIVGQDVDDLWSERATGQLGRRPIDAYSSALPRRTPACWLSPGRAR
ncbi:MAG TPA: hypothetical protein VGR23_06780 [Candidatus Dormibacteraeota bacterium]|nr:hypothetical protein [Candidatus Dormibacteraeota bacterium]